MFKKIVLSLAVLGLMVMPVVAAATPSWYPGKRIVDGINKNRPHWIINAKPKTPQTPTTPTVPQTPQ